MGSPTFSFAIALVLVETGFLITERVFEGMLMAQYYRDGEKAGPRLHELSHVTERAVSGITQPRDRLFDHSEANFGWFALMAGFIALPAVMETLYWVTQLRCCSRHDKEFKYGITEAKFWKWILFAVTFPISIVLR